MGFIFIVATVAFLAELTVEGLAGFAGGGRLGWGEGLMTWRHLDRGLIVMVKTCPRL